MPTWRDIAEKNYLTARRLSESPGPDYRSATSRFYYSVFSLMTSELISRRAQSDFRDGRETPGHAQLPALIEKHLTQFSLERRTHIAKMVSNLYRLRISSDYSSAGVDRALARTAHAETVKVFDRMGIKL